MTTEIPDMPIHFVNINDGMLQFEILKGCAYWHTKDVFTVGKRIKEYIMTKEGEPVWIRLEDGELVIEKLTGALKDKSTGYYSGGKIVEIARFDIYE